MTYKGYTANIRLDNEDRMLYGRIAGIRDVIHFEGKSIDEMEKFFKESVDAYLEACKKFGDAPEKPYSGKLHLRMPSDMHAKLAAKADSEGLSLNEKIVETLRQALA